ncbi:PREDICTED: uncharacterized protein At3g28850 [Nelumbo nucifera]|uniref:Uncharacterized protein At3g28850 n=1 Tax=Nelumbo nucifera TaxID=4432 RepID=A0A1U8B617_NELNU|nr:PREDICTED: uncharacterized protein At3g28850 [Nelumbo nucifera]
MGCVSSKLIRKELNQELLFGNGDYVNHVVSLTSSTYGVLKLDEETIKEPDKEVKSSPRIVLPRFQKKGSEEPEVINAWELMKDLEDEIPVSVQVKKSPKPQGFLRKVAGMDIKTPSKFFSELSSPRKQKKFAGKENKHRRSGSDGGVARSEPSPKQVLQPLNSVDNVQKRIVSLNIPTKNTPTNLKANSFRNHSGLSMSRRSLSPLFDPELVVSFEKELCEEGEQIKKMVSSQPKTCKTRDAESMLELFEKKCPPGGENAVVIYTTTLRGIRKTFEDCNVVRSVIESHRVHMIERDISMDSGFREELRRLMGTKDVRVPVVFVKGRLIGGAEEMVKMEEEGKLSILFNGIPRAMAGCEGCGGVRFVLCMDCSGSCKVLDEEQKKMVRCGECNENGLIQCPICC